MTIEQMSQDTEKYYFLSESWSLDPNQWSMILDSGAVLLAIFGVLLAFLLYKKQRKDNSRDAFTFFQSSLPELKQSIASAIIDLKEFNASLDLDNFVNPILSASLNDKFLSKVNLVHLNRYFVNRRKDTLSNYRQLLIDSNFFGNYHGYITKEINYFRTTYLEKKSTFSKWHLLRSKDFFTIHKEDRESSDYIKYYTQWVTALNDDVTQFDLSNQETPIQQTAKNALIEGHVQNLASIILPFISSSKRANEIHFLATKIVIAHKEMSEMKLKIRDVLEKDILKFEKVLSNLNTLLE